MLHGVSTGPPSPPRAVSLECKYWPKAEGIWGRSIEHKNSPFTPYPPRVLADLKTVLHSVRVRCPFRLGRLGRADWAGLAGLASLAGLAGQASWVGWAGRPAPAGKADQWIRLDQLGQPRPGQEFKSCSLSISHLCQLQTSINF